MRALNTHGPIYLLPMTPMSIAVYHLLQEHGIAVAGFCDNSARYKGAHYQNIPCIPPAQAAGKDVVFFINAYYGRTRTELLREAESLGVQVVLLEQILEKGDIDSILPYIDESAARALLPGQVVRDFAEIQQFSYILPPAWSGRGKIIDSLFLYSYRDMRQDFDDLAHSEDFIRRVIIKSDKDALWEEIVHYVAQSGRNIGIIQIQRSAGADSPLPYIGGKTGLSTPSYVVLPGQRILSRGNTHGDIPIIVMRDSAYPKIFDETNSTFVHIPKNSGSSLKSAFPLRSAELAHASARYLYSLDRDRFSRYFSFAIARNPWDRLVSGYTYWRELFLKEGIVDGFGSLCASISFQEMVYALQKDKEHLLLCHEMISPQYEWVCDEKGKVMVDYIGRFENLPETYARIAEGMHIPWNRDIPHANTSRHRPYQEYYNAETREIVGELFKTDIELFGYTFE